MFNKKYQYRCRVLLRKNIIIICLYRKCLRSRLQKILGGKSIQQLVELFYEDDINSRNTAGKKQSVKNLRNKSDIY